ncbi:polysaccharide deacetylase family protein [Desertibacillus haloalkaliphilus]|uniref:polysaccharide deacetylase family protein n=1 Tax=Desertibacillus haloalkaliphilus TaxID=1328930 RepID=UPI001C27F1FB|nr:polysaccharide deacetylase family protein [Desertibacillus haloalkaliphilus]MBU8906748.1 polysaccharide deacetylase family protein [Desertibacillus haloalkaliphilus]
MSKCLVTMMMVILLVGCQTGTDLPQPEAEGTNQTNEAVEKEQDLELEEVVEKSEQDEYNPEEFEEVDERQLEPRYRINEGNWRVEPIDDADKKVVLLTIDDAPENYSVDMAKTLSELGVNAIFFINGHFLDEEGREHLKTIHELGFQIGNHTMTHPNLRDLAPEEQREEIVALNDLIEEIIGERPRFFRAPFGANTDVSKQVSKEEGMQWMNWTYGYDWEPEYMDADALADIMVNTNLLSDGANILMHDREWTKDALPEIIKGIREQGYTFVDPTEIKSNE